MRATRSLWFGAILAAYAPVTLAQTSNSNINYLGTLTDGSGAPITTATSLQFTICRGGDETTPGDCPGGVSVWSEALSVTPDSNGRFDILLGKYTPLDFSILNTTNPLFLQVTVVGERLLPRTRMSLVQGSSQSATYRMESASTAAAKGVVVPAGRALFGGRMGVGTLAPTSQLQMTGVLTVGLGITVGTTPVHRLGR